MACEEGGKDQIGKAWGGSVFQVYVLDILVQWILQALLYIGTCSVGHTLLCSNAILKVYEVFTVNFLQTLTGG